MKPSRTCPRCDTPLEREKHLYQTHRGRFPDVRSVVWYCEACGWWQEVGKHSGKVLASCEGNEDDNDESTRNAVYRD